MPSLIAFGRRWNISSDDFVFPELTEAFVRLAWYVYIIGFWEVNIFIYGYFLDL